MKDNIEKKSIYNRKFIIDVKYAEKPSILDCRGNIIETIEKEKSNIFGKNPSYRADMFDMAITDSSEKLTNVFAIDINRIVFSSSNIDSIENYWNSFKSLFEIFTNNVKNVKFQKIGCRIFGTYKTKYSSYKEILKSFQNSIPDNSIIKELEFNNLIIQAEYQNGWYLVRPIKKDNSFLSKFPKSEVNDSTGIGIDTDNHYTDIKDSDNLITKIHDVFVASLSMEKLLFDKFNTNE